MTSRRESFKIAAAFGTALTLGSCANSSDMDSAARLTSNTTGAAGPKPTPNAAQRKQFVYEGQLPTNLKLGDDDGFQATFTSNQNAINGRHYAQTLDDIAALNDKYSTKSLGTMKVYSAIELLAQCIDPTDPQMLSASQLAHVLQILELMESEKVSEELMIAGLVHDLGKIMLLTDEDPANIVSCNAPVGNYEAGAGFDNIKFTWNHDEYIYMRLKNYLPEGVAWLIRYHSILPELALPYASDKDLKFIQDYYNPFARFDFGSKDLYHLPQVRLTRYRSLIEKWFPNPIVF